MLSDGAVTEGSGCLLLSRDRRGADAPARRPNVDTNVDAADMNVRATGQDRDRRERLFVTESRSSGSGCVTEPRAAATRFVLAGVTKESMGIAGVRP